MDSIDLLKLIKQAALDAVNASKPCNVVYGRVDSINPLRIQINQKLILDKSQLTVAEHLTDHNVIMNVSGGYQQTYTVHSGLKQNDKVIMLQAAGGQQYIVFDRVGVTE